MAKIIFIISIRFLFKILLCFIFFLILNRTNNFMIISIRI